MFEIQYTTQFKKDLKKVKNNKTRISKVGKVIDLLEEGGVNAIPKSMRPHKLVGNYQGFLECHIEGDYLLIWLEMENPNIITLTRLGSHSELF